MGSPGLVRDAAILLNLPTSQVLGIVNAMRGRLEGAIASGVLRLYLKPELIHTCFYDIEPVLGLTFLIAIHKNY